MHPSKAKIVLALHAHLPYVRIPEKKFPLQELWLYQALTESYIPLILCFNELIEEKYDFNITLSISPTLLSMLSDDYYKSKFSEYMHSILQLLRKKSHTDGPEKHSILTLLNRIQKISNYYIEIKGDITGELRKLSESSKVNLITTAATHALLPLFRFSDDIINGQIVIGQREFENAFGFVPEGLWLPEMGYYTNLDAILSSHNVKYTFLDAHSVYLTPVRPSYGNYYPSITKSGLKIFPRDLPLSYAIWSAKTGYPGDHTYREFHFDYTYSLSDAELKESGIDRIPFGLKIYRITGNDKIKEFYNYEQAMKTVERHADDFINKIKERASLIGKHMKRTPVFTLPFDAELFGHWWYEGPEFLKHVIKKITGSNEIQLISPNDIEVDTLDTVEPAESSWGREGFFKSWTNPECSWIYPSLAHLDVKFNNISSLTRDVNKKASNQLRKEILLASSSDWTFLIANDTSSDYAKARLTEHMDTAKKILEDIESGKVDEKFLLKRQSLYPIFNNINSI